MELALQLLPNKGSTESQRDPADSACIFTADESSRGGEDCCTLPAIFSLLSATLARLCCENGRQWDPGVQTGPLPAAARFLKRQENVQFDGYGDQSVDPKRPANFSSRLLRDKETDKSLRVSIISVKISFYFETQIKARI